MRLIPNMGMTNATIDVFVNQVFRGNHRIQFFLTMVVATMFVRIELSRRARSCHFTRSPSERNRFGLPIRAIATKRRFMI